MKGVAFLRIKSWRLKVPKMIVVLLLVALSPVMLSCYGNFPLTKALYRTNGNIENTVLRQVTFWVFAILPVYDIAIIGDALVFNLIEFWFGEEVDFGGSLPADGVALEPTGNPDEAVLTLAREDGTRLRLHALRVSETVGEIRDADGRLLGTARLDDDGSIRLTDSELNVIETVRRGQVAALTAGPR